MPEKQNKQLAEQIVKLLNELLAKDKQAVTALMEQRIPCNNRLANHPTIQVLANNFGQYFGTMGILNGICSIQDGKEGFIVYEYEDINGKRQISKFRCIEECQK